MKRFLILVMVLSLCFPTFATAESLFDFLITPAPEVSDKAPATGQWRTSMPAMSRTMAKRAKR